MIKYVLKPNLPEGKVDRVICAAADEDILKFFSDNGVEVFAVEANKSIDQSVASHADMAAIHLAKNIIVTDKSQTSLKELLKAIGFDVYETTDEIKGEYPDDVRLNFAVTGDHIIGNFKYADKNLLSLIADKNIINVRQGYCKCSVLVVSDNAVITDDEGVYRKLIENKLDALLITKGDVYLQGHEYGFIGGASGKVSEDTVVFFGDITSHRDFYDIAVFLSEHGCRYVCTDSGPLRDIGGIIPLTEK